MKLLPITLKKFNKIFSIKALELEWKNSNKNCKRNNALNIYTWLEYTKLEMTN